MDDVSMTIIVAATKKSRIYLRLFRSMNIKGIVIHLIENIPVLLNVCGLAYMQSHKARSRYFGNWYVSAFGKDQASSVKTYIMRSER